MLSCEFSEWGIPTYSDYPMSRLSTVHIGGACDLALFPTSVSDLIRVIDALEDRGEPYRIVGGMSNLLPSDEGYRGALISTRRIRGVRIFENTLTAEAGENLMHLCRCAAKRGFLLAPELSGIPGTLGGAVRGNAGAFGKEISDILLFATLYDPIGKKTVSLTGEELSFGYRTSRLFHERLYLLRATLALIPSDAGEELIELYQKRRKETQPHEPSLGSVFLRVGNRSAGELIDRAGLKGLSVGGAEISHRHAGFIINKGGARAEDFRALIGTVRERIRILYGIDLVCEIELM